MSRGHVRQVGDCVQCGLSSAALQSEVEVLRRRLLDRDVAIVQLEAQMAQDRPDHYPQPQVAVLRAQCDHWQDRYDRLLEAHKRLQKVNQGLEDKLLRLVDRTESEKSSLAADTASLTTALTTAAQAINRLKQENDRYKNDLNLAIQLLQCNPSKYATHKLHTLPSDLQKKAKTRLTKGEVRDIPRPEMKIIKVPIPTFPPTAMVYSVNKVQEETVKEEPVDAVSAAIMAAVLEERERERAGRHCPTCSCTTTQHKDHVNRNTDDPDLSGNNGSFSEDRLRDASRELRDEGLYESKADGEGRQWGSTGISKSKGDGEGKQWGNVAKYYSEGHKCESKSSQVDSQVERDGKREGRRQEATSFVNVVDVGTQVLPSYIGETGKVQSTCIYCHSSKTSSTERLQSSHRKSSLTLHSRSKSQPVNQPRPDQGGQIRGQDMSRPADSTSPTPRNSFAFGTHASWDWAAGSGGGDDSPSTPSTTPSSLVSASLSYESETSNGTSPQDSPLRPPLISAPRHGNPRAVQCNSDRQAGDSKQTDTATQKHTKYTEDHKQVDVQKYTDDLQGTDIYRHSSDTCRHTDTSGNYDQRHSHIRRQATETHRQFVDFHRQDSGKQSSDTHKSYVKNNHNSSYATAESIGKYVGNDLGNRQHTNVMESPCNSPHNSYNYFNSNKYHITENDSSSIQVKSSSGTGNSYHVGSYKIAFNARSPHHDVFTPPIHKSPTSNRSPPTNPSKSWSNINNRSWSPEAVIASSTTTASSTETTL